MLVDGGERLGNVGALDQYLYLPNEWLTSLVNFISYVLTSWRDDDRRRPEHIENKLTAQFCSHLNSACRHHNWDYLQFKREEPDEVGASRTLDLSVAPRASVIWLEGRSYSEYQTLLPIECKRLPTPSGTRRDEREYLYSKYSSTGGISRFKLGHHAADHVHAVMIGYIQNFDVVYWQSQIDTWINGLSNSGTMDWTSSDKLVLVNHNSAARSAHLRSNHPRLTTLNPIVIDHLWIEM